MSIKIENVEVTGFKAAIRGMRNPLESWDKSDSDYGCDQSLCKKCGFSNDWCGNTERYLIGPNDLDLMLRLAKAGSDHRKFMRMLIATMDITAGHTWWAEFDTYKVSTVRNSCSKMHRIHVHPFTYDMFDHEGIDEVGLKDVFELYINTLEELRVQFNETKEKKYWRALIEMLPMGFHLKATVQLSYETLSNIYRSRDGHKMFEWSDFCRFIETLPLAEVIKVAAGRTDKLREYEQLEKDGLLIKLPCPIGTDIYWVIKDCDNEGCLTPDTDCDECSYCKWRIREFNFDLYTPYDPKTMFLTRYEAERKLKEILESEE